MIAQLSIEILAGMAVTLLVALALLHYFVGARGLTEHTQSALSQIADSVASYPAGLASG